MKISNYGIKGILLCVLIFFVAPICWASDDFTIIIDAGHGGKDVGAADNGVYEKDINLGVARKLGEVLGKRIKGAKVVLTRDKDEYLTLQRRADIANNSKGDIFISIHTNSAAADNPNRSKAAGTSTHVLGASKDANNLAVTQRENSVIKLEKDYKDKYQGFNPDDDASYIIFEMMQKKNQRLSINLAEEIQKNLVTEAGRRDRGVHQNGFWVLWATSMPAVLVELDFICNPNSAKFIASKEGQAKLAEGIAKAVENYYKRYRNLAKEADGYDSSEKSAGKSVANNGAVLLARESDVRDDTAPDLNVKSASATKRRRRSDSARVKSEQRNLESSSPIATANENYVAQISEGQKETDEAIAEEPVDVEKQVSKKEKKGKSAYGSKQAHKNRRVGDVKAIEQQYASQQSEQKQNVAKSQPQTKKDNKAKPDTKIALKESTPTPKNKKVASQTKAVRATSDIQAGVAAGFGNIPTVSPTGEEVAQPQEEIQINKPVAKSDGKTKRVRLNSKH